MAQRRLKHTYYKDQEKKGASNGADSSSTYSKDKEDFDSSLATLAFATTTTHKGLSNNTGDNNCFLNATIQGSLTDHSYMTPLPVLPPFLCLLTSPLSPHALCRPPPPPTKNLPSLALWHLGPFRVELQDFVASHQYMIDVRFQQLSTVQTTSSSSRSNRNGNSALAPTPAPGNDELLRALCNMFNQYEFSEDAVVSPDELRSVISHICEKFRVGDIADANETLEAILDRIHSEWSPACPSKDGHKCIGHTVFGGLLMEQAVCQVRQTLLLLLLLWLWLWWWWLLLLLTMMGQAVCQVR
jgi:hypothetical protein